MTALRLALLALVFSGGCSCSTRYAKVHVAAIDEATGTSVSLKLVDAKNGQKLGVYGMTPSDFILTKKGGTANPTVSLLVGDRCYPTKWKIVEITKWVKRLSDANQAHYLNQIEIRVTKDDDCIWNLE